MPDRDEVARRVLKPSNRIGIDVQVVFRTPRAWDEATDPFTATVRDAPSVELDLLEGDEARGEAE